MTQNLMIARRPPDDDVQDQPSCFFVDDELVNERAGVPQGWAVLWAPGFSVALTTQARERGASPSVLYGHGVLLEGVFGGDQ